jgi:hypothetical protein
VISKQYWKNFQGKGAGKGAGPFSRSVFLIA